MNVIANILWPGDDRQAARHYVGFVVKLIEDISIDYSDFFKSPLPIAKDHLAGSVSDEDMKLAANEWKSYIDQNGYLTDFQSPNALKARLAFIALGVGAKEMQDKVDIGEHVEWAMLCCDKLINDDQKSLDIFDSYFEFKQ